MKPLPPLEMSQFRKLTPVHSSSSLDALSPTGYDEQDFDDSHAHHQKDKRRKRLTMAFSATLGLLGLLLVIVALFAQFDRERLLADEELTLLSQLIEIPSISGDEGEMGSAVAEWLQLRGWIVQKQQVTSKTFNVFAHRGNPNPTLIVNSHMDTVPPFIPFSEDSENIYGRGACDAKGSIVAQLFAVDQLLNENLLNPKDIGLLYVVEEETTSAGMKKANELGITPKYLIVGEPTERKLGAGHKGSLSFNIESFGKESHSGYPELGRSAITPLLTLLQQFEDEPWPYDDYFGQSTMNIGKISGGVAANVVPSYANSTIFIRSTVPYLELKPRVLELIGPNFTTSFLAETDPFKCDLVPGFESEIFSYGTDLPQFKGNHKSYLFGPGSILVAHTPGEYINKEELLASVQDYRRLILEVLSQES